MPWWRDQLHFGGELAVGESPRCGEVTETFMATFNK